MARMDSERPRSVAAAKRIVGDLSRTTKMPCHSWGLPAEMCKLGSILAKQEGTVCHDCYALRGAYVWRTTKAANARRLAQADHPYWVEAMALLVRWQARRNSQPYFRWFDTGDLQSEGMLERIVHVARQTPTVRHWLPTREHAIVRTYLREHTLPDNLTLRVSAHYVDAAPPDVRGAQTSTVHTTEPGGYACPAYAGKPAACMDCRACWDRSVENVSYPHH